MVKKIQLKNGMPVLLIENHKSPVVAVQMWVKTGSSDERRGEEGISHFIEHLVFKGTEKYQVGEIAAMIEGSGGELNAYTSFDQTVFHVTISREFVDCGLEAISQMLGFPQFDKNEIDNEREVVVEEIKRSNDSPGRQASQLLFSSCYKKHPYGKPVIGYEKIIRKVSHKTIRDYYQSRYVPSNMLLVVAGDFLINEIKPKINTHFCRFTSHKLRKVVRPKEQKQEKARIVIKQAPFEESHCFIAWPVPAVKHKDIPALDLLALILGQGDSSRLVKRLRIDEPVVNGVGSSSYTPQDAGLFAISMSLNHMQLNKAFHLLEDEILKILTLPPSNEEMQKAINIIESDEFYSLETVDGIAKKAGSLEILLNDHEYYKKYLKQIHTLTPNDITAIARKYLLPQRMTVAMLSPGELVQIKKELKQWEKNYKKNYQTAIGKKLSKTTKYKKTPSIKFSLSSKKPSENKLESLVEGCHIITRKMHETAVINIRAAFLGGVRAQQSGKEGLSELFSRIWTSGTKNLSEHDIYYKSEKMAGSLSAFAGRNTVGLVFEALAPFEEEGMELFCDVLANSIFSEEALNREKFIIQEQIKTRNDNPGYVVNQRFMEKLFGKHPYSRDLLGSSQSVESITREDILQYWQSISGINNLTFALTGAINENKWKKALRSSLANFNAGIKQDSNFSHASLDAPIYDFIKLDKEQSHIIFGFKGLTFTDPNRYALQVMQSILAGQGGRLFVELRDKASLAYSVAPMRMEGIDTGYVGAYIGCSPEKSGKAISMLRDQFNILMNETVDEAELDRAKRYLIGRHHIGLQKTTAVASAILFDEIYGVGHSESFHFAEKISEVNSESVRLLSQRLFSGPEVICLVGKECPW